MRRVVVITDPVTAKGFELVGVEIRPYEDAVRARREIGRLLKEEGIAVLVANDYFLSGADDWIKKHIESSKPPSVVSLPIAKTDSAWIRQRSLARALQEKAGAGRTAGAQRGLALHKLSKVTCTVCGHLLAVGMRICDKCGSIQRPTRARGPRVAAKMVSCRRCGVKIPAGRKLCAGCAASKKQEKAKSRRPFLASIAAVVEAIRKQLRRLPRREGK